MPLATAELYDLASGTWSAAHPIVAPRTRHSPCEGGLEQPVRVMRQGFGVSLSSLPLLSSVSR
jgi:hypothetical protein